MKILNECSFLPGETIKKIETQYNATYVLESCAKDSRGNWCNFPAAIFYTENAHPDGSNYFALYVNDSRELMIANGITAVDDVVFKGIEAEGEVTYSRYRHDYRAALNGAFVDGGRDYFRYGGDQFEDYNIVSFKVNKDKLEFLDAN